MNSIINKYSISFLLVVLFTSFAPAKKIKLYLIGDSTISVKKVNTYPETGWGMPFSSYFDSLVIVDNRAANGKSTKSFIHEKRWQLVTDSLQKGDYVFIQFGHNDEVPTKKSFTTETEFVSNLTRFVEETRSKNAFPVLITPVARRKFNEQGQAEDTHKVYAQLVRNTAAKLNVPLIDLSVRSMALLEEMGIQESRYLFNHLKPGQNPNYPNGVEDNTHFSEYGARRMAEIVLQEIKDQKLPLGNHIVKKK